MKKTILTTLIVAFVVVSAFAQTKATTEDGKKIIINEDGTWKYAEPEPTESITVSFECADLISNSTDKMTGKTTTSMNESLLISEDGETGFGIFVLQSGTSSGVIISIKAIGAGNCIDDDDKMNLLFRDGTRAEFFNGGKFNCEGRFTLYTNFIGKNKKLIEMLWLKEIETMRVWTSDGYVERDFTDEQSKILMNSLKCLIHN